MAESQKVLSLVEICIYRKPYCGEMNRTRSCLVLIFEDIFFLIPLMQMGAGLRATGVDATDANGSDKETFFKES